MRVVWFSLSPRLHIYILYWFLKDARVCEFHCNGTLKYEEASVSFVDSLVYRVLFFKLNYEEKHCLRNCEWFEISSAY